MKKIILLCALVGAAQLVSCGTRSGKKSAPETKDQTQQPPVGSDKDEHGCIGSAGYRWSEVQQKCIRYFEEGVRFVPATGGETTLAAYAVFSADSLKAELSIPGQEKNDILDRQACDTYGCVWKTAAADTKVLFKDPATGWNIAQGKDVIYKEAK